MARLRKILAAAGCLGLLAAESASAHVVIPGAGSWVNGFAHPLVVPSQGMLLLVAALLIAQERPFRPDLLLVICAGSGLLGLLSGWIFTANVPAILLNIDVLIVALCVVVAVEMPRWLRASLAGGAVFLVGLDSRPEAATVTSEIAMLAGTEIALVMVVNSVTFGVSFLPEQLWARVGVRIVASWMGAASLMLIAFAARR